MDHPVSAYVHGNVIDIVAAGIEQQISPVALLTDISRPFAA